MSQNVAVAIHPAVTLFGKIKKRPLWQQIVLALALGVLVGSLLGERAQVLQPLGDLFIHAIQMLVIPVIGSAIINGFLQFESDASMTKTTLKAFGIYVVSMVLASIFAILIANFFHPGLGVHPQSAGVVVGSLPPIMDVIANIAPKHPFQAMADGNILQVLVFSAVFGFGLKKAGPRAEPVAKFFKGLYAVVFEMVGFVMKFAPLGIFALMAAVTGTMGVWTLLPLLKFVAVIYIACFAYVMVYYAGGLLLAGISPLRFFQSIGSAIALAFSTTSSAATLPVTMQCARENLKIDQSLTAFLLPLGTNFNLNGLAIYLTVATVFVADMYHVTLTLSQYITLVISVVLSAAGAGGLPGTGMVVMSAVVGAVGLPVGAVSMLFTVDRLNDMVQTTTNVIGDLFACAVVAKSEKKMESE